MTTMVPVCAELPRAAEVAKLRRAVEGASGQERTRARGDLKWCLLDQARIVQTDVDALSAAIAAADEGDQGAIEALQLADRLAYDDLPPASAGRPDGAVTVGPVCVELDEFRRNLAQCRRQGAAFDTAWAQSLAYVRDEDQRAVRWSKRAWKAAYQRRPAPAGLSLCGWK